MSTIRSENGRIPLMLIHGAWLSARSWENYVDYFGKRGFDVSAPEWPRKHGDVEEMRETAEDSAGLGVREIVDHYDALVRELDSPPIIVGHSFGGAFTEILVDRGLTTGRRNRLDRRADVGSGVQGAHDIQARRGNDVFERAPGSVASK